MATEELQHADARRRLDRRAGRGLRGELIRPGDPGYDEARAIWNGAHDRRPALIVRCAGVADVMRAVEFARSENLLVAVRGGGHSIPGFSTCDGGIVIDLSADDRACASTRTRRTAARAGRRARGPSFDHETQAFGLAVTGGLVSTTGIAGFTLGGGIGWLDAQARPDLRQPARAPTSSPPTAGSCTPARTRTPSCFWGLRGGGGNFGIATSLEYRLHPVGPMRAGRPDLLPGRPRRARSCASTATGSRDAARTS